MSIQKAPQLEYQTYHEILTLIEKGFYEQASLKLRDVRKRIELPTLTEKERTWHTLSILLSSRIALKGGLKPDHIEGIDIASIKDPFLIGEVCFVKGLYYFNQAKMAEGANSFLTASQAFDACGKTERQWIARFNFLIGKSHQPNIDTHWLFTELRELEVAVQQGENNKLLGLILRQKSCLYKELGRIHAAKTDGIRAVSLLELHGAQSDYQLALLNMVDISLEQNELQEAHDYIDRVLTPLDPRVVFPYSFYKHRLNGTPLALTAKVNSCPHFLSRFDLWEREQPKPITEMPSLNDASEAIIWNATVGELKVNSKMFSFKVGSMETKLLNNIYSAPVSKELLSERLWPGFAQIHLLDNRLHRLISRVNKKLGGLIQYHKGQYFLSEPPVAETKET